MQMSYPSQKVVYNACFGGFQVPIKILQEVFRQCPPDTEEGKAIFWARRTLPLPESTSTFFGPYVLFSSGEYVGDLNTLQVYSLRSCNINRLRTNSHFQQILVDQGLVGKPLDDKTHFELAEVPFGCTYTIHEEDGKERVAVEVPWKALVEDFYLIAAGGGKIHWNPLTMAMLEDKTLARKILKRD